MVELHQAVTMADKARALEQVIVVVLKSEVGPTNTGSFIRRLRSAARRARVSVCSNIWYCPVDLFYEWYHTDVPVHVEGDVWENEEEWDELTLDALFRPDADGRREQEAVEPDELTDDDG